MSSLLNRRPVRLSGYRGGIVSFSFDDFPISAATTGAAILEAAGCRGTYYLSCGLLDANSPSGRIVSSEDVQRLAMAGHEIGCHTYSHFRAEETGGRCYGADITRNFRQLTELLPSQLVRSFAFPYGSITPSAKAAAASYYVTCRTTRPCINRTRIDANQLNAIALYETRDNIEAINKLISDCSCHGGWLIIYTHDVDKNHSPYGCTPEQLRSKVHYALDSGCAVRTIGDVAITMLYPMARPALVSE